jgi:hypothetical protein
MASYFLGSQLLGTSRQLPKHSDDAFQHSSEALFCPVCGEVWGRVHEPAFHSWHVTIRECRKHSTRDSAGSFIAPWRATFAELPPEVLAYEAILRLERYQDEQS